jgi:hypothetical protein
VADNFTEGESDADTGAPPIETMGARYGINVKLPQTGRGAHEQQTEPYLMPSVHGRNGSLERTVPAIVQTPLGGMMPGPNAIPPAIVVGSGYFAVPEPGEGRPFGAGIGDSYPEGCPVPWH